jgi:hypothetical protein
MQSFRLKLEYPGILEEWRSLRLVMCGAACRMATDGLLLGIVLGTSLAALPTAVGANGDIEVLYYTGGILP